MAYAQSVAGVKPSTEAVVDRDLKEQRTRQLHSAIKYKEEKPKSKQGTRALHNQTLIRHETILHLMQLALPRGHVNRGRVNSGEACPCKLPIVSEKEFTSVGRHLGSPLTIEKLKLVAKDVFPKYEVGLTTKACISLYVSIS
jgi:hypothetical protein